MDFQNADPQERVRLNTLGTAVDIARQAIALAEGLIVTVYSEEFETQGVVEFSKEEHIWTAAIDWGALIEKRSPTPVV